MAEGITLLEITVEPTRGINEIIKEGYEAVLHGLRKAHAKKFHAFKVMGENKFVVVAAGDVDRALRDLNNECGDKVRVKSTPLRSYFSFAEKILGVDKSLLPSEIQDLSHGGNMYWMHAEIGYEGKSLESLKHIWFQEATLGIPEAKKVRTEMSAFKTILQRDVRTNQLEFFEVHVFLKNSPADIDAMAWTLPMWREMGDNIKVTCKPIKHMD